MSKSREGRHTAKASTWLIRLGLAKDREDAVKLVKRGKVKIKGLIAKTGNSYTKIELKDIECQQD
jgi:ribosomal 50S subunit-recycling heat shock protein